MKKISLFILLNATLLVFNSGCIQSHGKTQDFSDKRSVDIFDKIIMSGGYASVEYSASPTLEIIGAKSCIEHVDIKVSENTLFIKSRDNDDRTTCRVSVKIGIPSLKAIEQHGGGEIFFGEGFKDQREFRCTIDGGGKIDLLKLNVRSFYASIRGGGAITLSATDTLEGKIRGGGSIRYRGNPTIISDISGGGTIKKI